MSFKEGDRVRSICFGTLGTVVSGQQVPLGWGDTLIPVHWDGCPAPGRALESEIEILSPLERLAETAE